MNVQYCVHARVKLVGLPYAQFFWIAPIPLPATGADLARATISFFQLDDNGPVGVALYRVDFPTDATCLADEEARARPNSPLRALDALDALDESFDNASFLAVPTRGAFYTARSAWGGGGAALLERVKRGAAAVVAAAAATAAAAVACATPWPARDKGDERVEQAERHRE